MHSRETAVFASKRAWQQLNAQFLDDTVVLRKLRLCRTQTGSMALYRLYSFEFSIDREARQSGRIMMRGHNIEDIILDIDEAERLHSTDFIKKY